MRVRFVNPPGDRKWVFLLINMIAPVVLLIVDTFRSAEIISLVAVQVLATLAMYRIDIETEEAHGVEDVVHIVPEAWRDQNRIRGKVLFRVLLAAIFIVDLGIVADLGWPFIATVVLLAPVTIGFAYATCRFYRSELRDRGLSW